MLKKIISVIAIVSTLLVTTGMLAPVSLVSAQSFDTNKKAACEGVQGVTGASCADTGTINKLLTVMLNLLSFIIGVTAVIMIMIAGFRFITSQGDSNTIASARNTILYAVIGLVVVVMAQFIIYFVLSRVKA